MRWPSVSTPAVGSRASRPAPPPGQARPAGGRGPGTLRGWRAAHLGEVIDRCQAVGLTATERGGRSTPFFLATPLRRDRPKVFDSSVFTPSGVGLGEERIGVAVHRVVLRVPDHFVQLGCKVVVREAPWRTSSRGIHTFRRATRLVSLISTGPIPNALVVQPTSDQVTLAGDRRQMRDETATDALRAVFPPPPTAPLEGTTVEQVRSQAPCVFQVGGHPKVSWMEPSAPVLDIGSQGHADVAVPHLLLDKWQRRDLAPASSSRTSGGACAGSG